MGKTRALSGHVRNAQSAVGIRLDMENECSREGEDDVGAGLF